MAACCGMAPATNRKLQTDIDRCLKKVHAKLRWFFLLCSLGQQHCRCVPIRADPCQVIDGRAEFEELWLKVQAVEVRRA